MQCRAAACIDSVWTSAFYFSVQDDLISYGIIISLFTAVSALSKGDWVSAIKKSRRFLLLFSLIVSGQRERESCVCLALSVQYVTSGFKVMGSAPMLTEIIP